ncbi:hypothetical protein GCM10027592_41350 [Spirosoma flavus]
MKINYLSLVLICAVGLLTCTKELAPLTNAEFKIQNGGCEAPCEVSFTGPSGDDLRYRWDFGDNTTSSEQSPKKTYATANNYIVKLVVTGSGGSAISSQSLSIKQNPNTRQYLTGVSYASMTLVKGGTFQMGDTRNEGLADEKPVHQVTVSDFFMGQYEVTQQQWRAVMGSNPSSFTGCDDCPVEQVSWDDAQQFLQKINQQRSSGTPAFRLPTEAEWEYAAGGGAISSRSRFGNGKDIANPAEINFVGSAEFKQPYSVEGVYRAKTIKVGSFAPNGLGLYDLSGNVWEWCSDLYANYTSAAVTNPTGAASGTNRIFRGGGWRNASQDNRNTYRFNYLPSLRSHDLGFRIVCSAQ